MKKRILALLLALSVLVQFLPGGVAERTAAAEANLALGKTGICKLPVFNGGYGPEKMVDGSTANTSRWSANWGAINYDEWAGADIQKPMQVHKVTIKEFRARIKRFQIETSLNGEDWSATSAGEETRTVNDNAGSFKNNLNTWSVEFDPVPARYVRIFIFETGVNGASIFEFEVYGSELPDSEEAFDGDVAGVTQDSLLGENPSADSVKSALVLPQSPLPGGTSVTWSSDNEALSDNGRVTRPFDADASATLTAHFVSPQGTYTRDVDFPFLILRYTDEEKQAMFEEDTASVSEDAVLGDNLALDYVTTSLNLMDGPLTNGSSIRWEAAGDTECIDLDTGAVTRDEAVDQQVTLTAHLSSPDGTLTKELVFEITVRRFDPSQADREVFDRDCYGVKSSTLLSGNPSPQQVKFDLNLPVSPLAGGTLVEWESDHPEMINERGEVIRPTADTEVTMTARFRFMEGESVKYEAEREYAFTVLAAETDRIWKQADQIAFDNIYGTSNYSWQKRSADLCGATLENGLKLTQTTNAVVAEADRPKILADFSNKITAGNWYYIEVKYIGAMKAGVVRLTVNNSSGGEGALFQFGSADNAIINLAAKDLSTGKRAWVDSQVDMRHRKNTPESVGILFDTVTSQYQFCKDGRLASDKKYGCSYGSGVSGILLDFQGGAGGQGGSFAIEALNLYEFDPVLMAELQSDVDSVTIETLTDLPADSIFRDLNSLPTGLDSGTRVEWESSDPSVIGSDGKVTRHPTQNREVTLTASFSHFGETVTKMFTFNVLAQNNVDAEIGLDQNQITYELLTDEAPQELTKDLKSLDGLQELLPCGSALRFESSHPAVLSHDGKVSRDPELDQSVTLTAYFTKNGTTKQKPFSFTVLASGRELPGNLARGARVMSSEESGESHWPENAVDQRYTTAWITSDGAEQPSLTLDLGGSTQLANAVLREAASGEAYLVQEAVLEVSGNGEDFTQVATLDGVGESTRVDFYPQDARFLRYRVTKKAAGDTGLYELEVYYQPKDEDRVELDRKSYKWTGPTVVTENLSLPQKGAYGSEMKWSSTDESVVSSAGVVTRSAETRSATLSVTFYSGSAHAVGISVPFTVPGTGKPTGPSGGGGSSSGGGGKGSASGIVPIIPPVAAGGNQTTEPPQERFPDVASSRWSYPYIKTLNDEGILTGGEDGRIAPEDPLTREQLVKMMAELLKLPKDTEDSGFSDVAADAWFAGYVTAAKKAGIISGIDESHFGTGQEVTRQDMAVMLCRALDAAGKPLSEPEATIAFTDSEAISSYAAEAVGQMTAAGMISGMDGAFCPMEPATREQAAKILCLVLEHVRSESHE